MKISVASDHAGFDLKEKVKQHLTSAGHEVFDRGCYEEASVDYPDYGVLASRDVADGIAERAVVVCGAGIGMSMVANKIRGVRCALCTSAKMAEMSRLHNDANALALGARYLDHDLALEILDTWLKTDYEGGRHQRRLDKMMKLSDY